MWSRIVDFKQSCISFSQIILIRVNVRATDNNYTGALFQMPSLRFRISPTRRSCPGPMAMVALVATAVRRAEDCNVFRI